MQKPPIDKKQILRFLKGDRSIRSLKKCYAKELEQTAQQFQDEFKIIEQRAKRAIVDDHLLERERADAADRIHKKYPHIAKVIFAIMDGREYDRFIWDIIEKQI